jgi:hypothetical protein
MRIPFAILLMFAILLPVGCNSDLRCRRETALLRAEYLDLEDKYYSLLAQTEGSTIVDSATPLTTQYDNAVFQDSGLGVNSQHANAAVVDYGQPVGSGVIIHQSPVSSDQTSSEITYYDQGPSYYSSGQMIPAESAGTVMDAAPTPAPPLSTGSSTRSNSSVEASPLLDQINPNETGQPASLLDDRQPSPEVELPSEGSVIDEFDGISILDPSSPRMKAELSASSKVVARVSRIQINPSVSRGENTDGIPGDDELKLLLQPMTESGNVLEQAGNLTISLVDPAAEQGQQQVGYWEFVRNETELFFARDEFNNRGLLLNLPWSDAPPSNANLTVYVRYETPSGNVIETTDGVTIDPPSPSLSQQYRRVEQEDELALGDWYKGQARRRSYGQSTQSSSIRTRPIKGTSSFQQNSDDYYSSPAWKPVR